MNKPLKIKKMPSKKTLGEFLYDLANGKEIRWKFDVEKGRFVKNE